MATTTRWSIRALDVIRTWADELGPGEARKLLTWARGSASVATRQAAYRIDTERYGVVYARPALKDHAARLRKWAAKDSPSRRRLHQQNEAGRQVEPIMKKADLLLARIEAFNAVQGGGVIVQKAAKGYSLYREDTGQPVARLQPTGKRDQVEVKWWSHRATWDQIGDFGPMVMPLDEALDYIAQDPMGCFWH